MSDFANKGDIIKEVSKRLDIPKEKVEAIFSFTLGYLHSLTKMKEVLSIFIPNLGRLYVKKGYLRNRLHYYSVKKKKYGLSENDSVQVENLQYKLDYIEKNTKRGTSKLKWHYKKSKLLNKYFNGGKSIEELEKFQNEE